MTSFTQPKFTVGSTSAEAQRNYRDHFDAIFRRAPEEEPSKEPAHRCGNCLHFHPANPDGFGVCFLRQETADLSPFVAACSKYEFGPCKLCPR